MCHASSSIKFLCVKEGNADVRQSRTLADHTTDFFGVIPFKVDFFKIEVSEKLRGLGAPRTGTLLTGEDSRIPKAASCEVCCDGADEDPGTKI